jgi:hypothetical protein
MLDDIKETHRIKRGMPNSGCCCGRAYDSTNATPLAIQSSYRPGLYHHSLEACFDQRKCDETVTATNIEDRSTGWWRVTPHRGFDTGVAVFKPERRLFDLITSLVAFPRIRDRFVLRAAPNSIVFKD